MHERALGDAQSTLVELASEDTVFTDYERLRRRESASDAAPRAAATKAAMGRPQPSQTW